MEKKTEKKSLPKSKPTVAKKANELKVVDLTGKEVASVSVPDNIFNIAASDKLLSLYVRVYLNNTKFNFPSTKTRGEVVGSTRKIYRQKGTGRARHGANTAPIFVGGGIAHGPRGVAKKLKMNKKQRIKALFYSLSSALKNNQLMPCLDADKIDGTTKQLNKTLNDLSADKKTLLVYSGVSEKKFGQAGRNLEDVKLTQSETLNAYHVISSKKIMFTKKGFNQFIKIHNKQ